MPNLFFRMFFYSVVDQTHSFFYLQIKSFFQYLVETWNVFRSVLFCFFLLCFFFISVHPSNAREQVVYSPFNGLKIPTDSIRGELTFIVTGHLHGSSNNASGFPAASLLANLDTINKLGADFMVSLGDLFMDVDDYHINNYKKSFFDKLKIPLFNAVGNHDRSGNRYQNYFGSSFFYFTIGDNCFIFLDTEMNDGRIKGEQMVFLKQTIAGAKTGSGSGNIFIFSHRPVWAENNPLYEDYFKDNTRTSIGSNNFESEVYPLLTENLEAKNIYWFSGSLGTAPASFFYDKPHPNITYVNTAIRDLKRDAIIKVSIEQGEVKFTTFSLTGQQLETLENYNHEFWKKNSRKAKQEFNYRLLPYLTMNMIKNHYFLTGFFSGVLLMIGVFYFGKRKKK